MSNCFNHYPLFFKFLLSIFFLFVAWFGFYQLKQSILLYSNQNIQQLKNDTEKIATSFKGIQAPSPLNKNTPILYVHQQFSQNQIDGYQQDWQDSLLLDGGLTVRLNSKQYFKVSAAEDPHFLYLLLNVTDDYIIYRNAAEPHPQKADYIRLKFSAKGNDYILSTFIEGDISAINIQTMRRDHHIQGVWRETTQGYRLELRIPQIYLKDYIWIEAGDIDDPELPAMRSMIRSPAIFLLHQNKRFQNQLLTMNTAKYHVRILNQQGWVIADKKPSIKVNQHKRDFQSITDIMISRLFNDQNMPFKPDNYHSLKLKIKKQGVYHYQLDYLVKNQLTRIFYPLNNTIIVVDQITPLFFLNTDKNKLFVIGLILLVFLLVGIWLLITSICCLKL